LASCAMSLSVRSIASLSYNKKCKRSASLFQRAHQMLSGTYPCSAHVLNGGDFVAYSLQTLISIQLASAVSVLFNAPRRSSSRSVRQLMKERELLIRSVVSLMLAVWARFALLVEGNGVGSLVGARRA
jgi:hypothetical protein